MKDIILINPQPVVLKKLFAETVMYANPPLGLGYLASMLRCHGYEPSIYDIGPLQMTVRDLIAAIENERCQIVGISSMVGNHGNGMRLAKMIKQANPDIKIIMGGPQATFLYGEILETGDIDIVCRYEGEETIVELMDTFRAGKDLAEVKGIAYRNADGNIVTTETRQPIKDLDSLPFPAWDLFPLKSYDQPGIIISGRGCPYKCIFCAANALSGQKYRIRSARNVVDEIEALYREHQINHMFIADDTFTAIKKHCLEICHEIQKRGLDIAWEAEARANTVDDEIASEMAKAGCIHVQIGAESGDDDILKAIEKNITTDLIERAVRVFLRNGISVVCSFIIGHPYDTRETIEKTIDFAIRLHRMNNNNLVTCKFALLTPLPGTPVYEQRDQYGLKLISNNWDLATFFDPFAETRHLNRRELQNLYLSAWMRYAEVEVEKMGKKQIEIPVV